MRRALLAFALFGVAAAPAEAAKSRTPVTVVAAGGSPIARDVATSLEKKGVYVDLAQGGGAPAPSIPLEPAKACIAEGRSLAFRLEYGAAIAALESCLERVGPALSRPEGQPALSSLFVELGAASVGAGERERARSAFARLARLPDPTPPDPSVHPPPVMQAWEDARRTGEPTSPIVVDATPPWTTVWIDGRAVTSGERLSLAQGPHFASADAAGFQPWSGILLVEGGNARLPVRLAPLDPDARAASVRARAGSIPPNAPGAAEELTSAFGMAVLVVGGGRGAATSGVLLLPSDPGKGGGATVAGRWTPASGENPADVIATGVSRQVGGRGGRTGDGGFRPGKRTLYIAGGTIAGILAVGAAATLLQPGDPGAGAKEGSVVWEPPPPPLPPHGKP